MSADAAIRILRFVLESICRFHQESVSGHPSSFNQECRTLLGDCRREHSKSVFGLVQSVRGVKRTRFSRTYMTGKIGELLTERFVCRLLKGHTNEMGMSL